MRLNRYEHTKNPARIIAGKVRYRTGLWVEEYIENRDDRKDWTKKKNKIRRAIWEYGIDSEGAYNCTTMPLLGKIIKWQTRKDRTMKKWHKLYSKRPKTDQEKKRVEKLWKKMKREEAMMDKWLKFEDPDYITKAEERANEKERFDYYHEHGEFPDTPPLIQGAKRFTDEEWKALKEKRAKDKKPPIAL